MNNFASFNGRLSNYHNYELDLEYLLLILKRGGGCSLSAFIMSEPIHSNP